MEQCQSTPWAGQAWPLPAGINGNVSCQRGRNFGVVRFTALYLNYMLIGGLNNAGIQCTFTLLGTAIGSGCPVCCAWPGGPSLRDVALLALPESPIPSEGATAVTYMRKGALTGENVSA